MQTINYFKDPRFLLPEDFFLDIADDGFAITGGNAASLEEISEARQKICSGAWPICPTMDRLGECRDITCGCCREYNPTARTYFMRSVIQCLAEVCRDREGEVILASLGSGLLRFDLELLESALEAGIPVTAMHLVDPAYDKANKENRWQRAALAQFCSWFADRLDVYAHLSIQEFALRARKAGVLPVAVLQVIAHPLFQFLITSSVQSLKRCFSTAVSSSLSQHVVVSGPTISSVQWMLGVRSGVLSLKVAACASFPRRATPSERSPRYWVMTYRYLRLPTTSRH